MLGKLDENMPVEAAELLRVAGWTCDTVLEEGLRGAEDRGVSARCQAEGRVLFTLDLDLPTSGPTLRASIPASSYSGQSNQVAARSCI
jgi:predicted nuclease of predicted toxin-antitoxin system